MKAEISLLSAVLIHSHIPIGFSAAKPVEAAQKGPDTRRTRMDERRRTSAVR
jgi:hypothetical protein